jgi:hypothetical protein
MSWFCGNETSFEWICIVASWIECNLIELKFLDWSELNQTKYYFSFGFNKANVPIEIPIELNLVEFNQMELN